MEPLSTRGDSRGGINLTRTTSLVHKVNAPIEFTQLSRESRLPVLNTYRAHRVSQLSGYRYSYMHLTSMH